MALKIIPIFIFLSCSAAIGQQRHAAFSEHITERHELVFGEVADYRGIEISDSAVLQALATVPRHYFVPESMIPYAYLNRPLPIGYDQTISQPVIVASMTQLLQPLQGRKVLEIGTGSGYQAAILAQMGARVYTIEIVEPLGKKASLVLEELGYDAVEVKIGDGYEGWDYHAPYDRIIVTCAPESVPDPLIAQLKPGGWIVIPVGAQNKIQYLVVMRKTKSGKLKQDIKYPVRFVPMTGKAQERNIQP